MSAERGGGRAPGADEGAKKRPPSASTGVLSSKFRPSAASSSPKRFGGSPEKSGSSGTGAAALGSGAAALGSRLASGASLRHAPTSTARSNHPEAASERRVIRTGLRR